MWASIGRGSYGEDFNKQRMMPTSSSILFILAMLVTILVTPTDAFVTVRSVSATQSRAVSSDDVRVPPKAASPTELYMALYSPGRAASRGGSNKYDSKSKRQYRVGQLVQTELASILHSGVIKGDSTPLDSDLRQRISVVSVDVSPDLRQARVSVSIRKTTQRPTHGMTMVVDDDGNGNVVDTEDIGVSSNMRSNNPIVDKRRAYSWLVENTKPLRHTLAQRLSHLKTSPSLTFVQVDVSAAVDVMYLIDKVSKGYERQTIGGFGGDGDDLPNNFVADEDDMFEDDVEWDEEDDDFFKSE